jgi:hypothetical protein
MTDLRIVMDKKRTEDGSSEHPDNKSIDFNSTDENYLSQLTMDSQTPEIEDERQLSQESVKESEVISKIPEITERIEKRDESDMPLMELQETQKKIAEETYVNESTDYSINDTPGKDIARQISKYNEQMNQDSPFYGDIPIQEQREIQNQYQDSEDDSEAVNQRRLLDVQNILFLKAASDTGNEKQQQGDSEGDQRKTGDDNENQRNNDSGNSRENP